MSHFVKDENVASNHVNNLTQNPVATGLGYVQKIYVVFFHRFLVAAGPLQTRGNPRFFCYRVVGVQTPPVNTST